MGWYSLDYFSSRLKFLRTENNITQNKLANILGYSRSTIAKYESGKMIPSGNFLIEMADYFRVSTDYLLGRTNLREGFDEYLFNRIPDVLLFISPANGKIIDHSSSAIDFYGYEREELLNMTVYDLNTLPNNKIDKLMKKTKQTKQNTFYFTHRLSNGELKDIKVSTTKLTLHNKKVIVALIQDISEIQNKTTNDISDDLIKIFNKLITQKLPYKNFHNKNVPQLACEVGNHLSLSNKDMRCLKIASTLQDIGELKIPNNIMNSPYKLSNEEFSIIKNHPLFGVQLLENTSIDKKIKNIILQHHERIDGSGYPKGLKGKDILLEAKILGVVDTVIALVSKRPHRTSYDLDFALKIITKMKGRKFDKKIVSICKYILKDTAFKFKH